MKKCVGWLCQQSLLASPSWPESAASRESQINMSASKRKGWKHLPSGLLVPQPASNFGSYGYSEMDKRSKCDAQIVVRAAVKIHFIRDIEAQAQGTEPTLKSGTGTKHAAQGRAAKIIHAADKRGKGRGPLVEHEVDETTFQRDEGSDTVMATEINFRPK